MTQPIITNRVLEVTSFGQFWRISRYWVFILPFIISDLIGLVFFRDEDDDF
jgi:hypothetical protein